MFGFFNSAHKPNPNAILDEQLFKIRLRVRELDRKIITSTLYMDDCENRIKTYASTGKDSLMISTGSDYFSHKKQHDTFVAMKRKMVELQLKVEGIKNQAATTDILEGVTEAFRAINETMDIDEINNIKLAFEEESMKTEAISETIDDLTTDFGDTCNDDDMRDKIYKTFGSSLKTSNSDEAQLEERYSKLTKVGDQ
jgi:predicted 3-demethylubiquinone-9 3-methyltransferase (glyoxalase superfamily)